MTRPTLSRRHVLTLPAIIAARPVAAHAAGPAELREWRAFRGRFIAADGRVIDTGNGGISHSEGQGWGLLLAERFGDRACFDLLLGWTRRVLARPRDALHAWKYSAAAAAVVDGNNATDGDLMIAWALLRAQQRWGGTEYGPLGTATARDILRLTMKPAAGRLLLLPGARGFEHRDHVVVNPSYYAFPAFRPLAAAVPDPRWLQMAGDGLALLRAARFGRWGLPPDWLAVPRERGAPLALAPDRLPRFSYDAIRVPLYLAWAGLADEPPVSAAVRFWRQYGGRRPPAWADLRTDALAPYDALAGMTAVARLARAAQAERELTVNQTSIVTETDYYSAALSLLSRVAWRDSALRGGE
jgi:endoglucanase